MTLVAAIAGLLPQLSSTAAPPSEAELAEIVAGPATRLLVARLDGRIVGSLTLVLFRVPSGGDGLKEASQVAVLNANYLKARLAEEGIADYLPIAFDRTCMHEFVVSGRGARERLGIKTLDIAKRMLDHRVHPPTVHFPLLVDEALMIEPTETETKDRLDDFAAVVRAILEEAREDPEITKGAPYTTPVRRLDEAGAAKRPAVRWRPHG